MDLKDLKVKIFADGASLPDMLTAYQGGIVKGFTTNPSLMKKAGITDYKAFAREVLAEITDCSVSFEVFSDDFGCVLPIKPDKTDGRWRVGKKKFDELLKNGLVKFEKKEDHNLNKKQELKAKDKSSQK